jgi:signal transduction histidine kinase
VAATGLVALGGTGVGYQNYAGHLVLETAQACIALAVSYLAYGRFLRTRRLQDLLLAQALILMAVSSLGMTVMVLVVGQTRAGTIDVWLPLGIRLVGVALLALAATESHRRVASSFHHLWSWGVITALTALLTAGLAAWSAALPVALDPARPPGSGLGTYLPGHPSLNGVLLFNILCFGIAAVGFTLQAQRGGDELIRWMGPACALAMFARIDYLLFPSLYSDWIYPGDFLRLGFYLLLIVGAARELQQYWGAHSMTAVIEDRRRLARELHDGLMQELAFIRAESFKFETADPTHFHRVIDACDRALDEAREAVEALGHTGEEPLGLAVHRAAKQVAERHELSLELELDDTIAVDEQQRHALLRLVREAMSNAARHGKASRVCVELADGPPEGRRLVVVDNGLGFDVLTESARPQGFGLTSMRERAAGLPGSLEIRSQPRAGTTVVVRW